jgi:hypothetical protein
VLRPALILLAVIVVLAVVLTSRPVPLPPTPSRGVVLQNVRLDLYPEQDPEATWKFEAGQVEQDPGSREARVSGLKGGERYVGAKLDLRLKAPSVIIDRADNLRLPYATVEILEGCYRLELGKPGEGEVLVDQRSGFSAPSIHLTAPGIEVFGRNFRSDFGMQSPTWNIQKESAQTGGELPPCEIEGGR